MATIQSKGILLSLVAQLDKLARHNRQGSFRTKGSATTKRANDSAPTSPQSTICKKLENISGKHLVSYVLYLAGQWQVCQYRKNRPCRHSFLPR